jgi:hypothetical protein
VHSEPRFRGFRSHPQLEGTHAILSPSQYAWINYTPEKMEERLKSLQAAARGTSLHALAAHAIKERIYFSTDNEEQLALAGYVNDAIDFEMKPEQMLVYSVNCYGQADAIGFEETEMFLRVHDFKSGVSPTSEKQLYVYAALFCLEYQFLPYEMGGELRIYQFDGYRSFEIDSGFLAHVYDMIRMHDQHIEESRAKRGTSWTSR